jgi:hypothetical protein
MVQNQHLRHTKEQIEYDRIDKEYEFVKKRALTNFLVNAKLNAEANFHKRTVSMLGQIENFENANLKANMKEIAAGSVDKVLAQAQDASQNSEIKEAAFKSALAGISSGVMTYEHDLILPLIQEEMKDRLLKFQGLSAEEESKLLQLTAE